MSYSDHQVVLRNYEGYISTYEEPLSYEPIDPALVAPYKSKFYEPGQTGVAGLLDGEAMTIKPEGFDQLHLRGGEIHRLREKTDKWVPRGIGDGKPK